MRRVIIADDDMLVCRYLSQLIHWEENGYQLSGTARDGAQALELIRTVHPDIVITDIEMPVMNGIELLKRIKKEENRNIKVVILSCHDDFAYVKEAMRIGADEYFLKDEITGEKLLVLLNQLEVEPGEKDGQSEGRKNSGEAEEKQLRMLLDGTLRTSDVIRPDAVLAVHLTGYEERAAFSTTEQREKFYASFCEVCGKQAEQAECSRTIHIRGGWFSLLYQAERGLSTKNQRYQLREMANRILYQADRQFEMAVTIGIAETAENRYDIAASWNRARGLTGFTFYEKNDIFCGWQYGRMGEQIPQAAAEFLEKAENWKVKQDFENLGNACETALSAFREEKTKESVVASWLRSADRLIGLEARPLPRQFEQMQSLPQEYLKNIREQLPDTQGYSEGVTAVIRYIRQNFRNNISLNDAANAVHLTPAYLSYIFHKETDITFSEYLQSCRISHAKELLEHTDEKLRDIGPLSGYNDSRHFGKIFKKVTGMTPQEYRKDHKK